MRAGDRAKDGSRAAASLALVPVLALGLAACASSTTLQQQDLARQHAAEARKPQAPKDYVLTAGDTITVKFLYNPELNEQLPIRPDGKAALQIVGDVAAAGLTVPELRQRLMEKYTGILKHPEVVVLVNSFGAQKVYVGGEVGRPGEIPLAPGMTTLQAIIMAGGELKSASTRNVVIVRDQGTETPLFLLVDLKQGLSTLDESMDVRLQPRDIVFVPMSTVAKVDNFVRQYIKELLPVSLVFGVYYNFGSFLQPKLP